MPKSLKTQLNNLLQERGRISRREILLMCDGYSSEILREEGVRDYPFGRTYELSNAEKRIRSDCPNIAGLDEDGKPARETNKAIKTYVWVGEWKKTYTYKPSPLDPSVMIQEEIILKPSY